MIPDDLPVSEEEYSTALESIKSQLLIIDENTKGTLIITCGNENYMVSHNITETIKSRMVPDIKKRYPDLLVLFVPWYLDFQYMDMKKLMEKNQP